MTCPLSKNKQHALMNVGWGMQCGLCGYAFPNADTSEKLRAALMNSGVKLYDIEDATSDMTEQR